MQNTLSRLIETITLPLLLLVGAYLAQPLYRDLPLSLQPVMHYLPYAVFVLGILLCLLFNRSRVIYLLLALSASYWAFSSVLENAHGPWDKPTVELIFNVTCLLTPLNFWLASYLPERGATSWHALMRYSFLAMQIILLGSLAQQDFQPVLQAMTRIYWPPLQHPTIHLAQLSLFAMLIAVLGVSIKAILQPSPINSATLAATLAFIISSNWMVEPGFLLMFHAMAGLILSIGVILDSYNMAYLDELTGIPARRALNEQLMRLGRRYAIAMLDVDHFKKFNDTHGHDVGDQVLKMVAQHIQQVRGGGKVFRYGGEEFCIVFPSKSVEAAKPHLEQVRQSIADYEMKLRSKSRPSQAPEKPAKKKASTPSVSVTISIGVAERSREVKMPEEVIKAADEALYRAKKGGRNQVRT